MNPDFEVVDYDVGKDDYRNVARYDERRYVGGANEYKRTITSNAYQRLIGPLQGRRILDVGCGTGRGVAEFVEVAQLTVGADASQDMLVTAARKIQGRPRVGLVRSYAQSLPFPTGSFDVAISLNFLHLFSLHTQKEMIAEMKRVVRPGGIVVLEFDNAIHGLGLGLIKRWGGRERGSLPWEIRQVIGGNCRVTHIYGAVFPVVWRLFYRFAGIFTSVEKIAYYPPFNWVAHRIFFRLVTTQP
jgi:ubiquinone/menaquinone biosynthesis C-methylase UbiE